MTLATIHKFLAETPMLLLFVVIAIGQLVGRIKIAGFELGVAAILFSGIAIGSWKVGGHGFEMPTAVAQTGLVLFVYTVGLVGGPGFFDSLKRRGVPIVLASGSAVLAGAGVCYLSGRWLQLSSEQIAGAFCGGLTNTPALAAATQRLNKLVGAAAAGDAAVAYSVAYVPGVVVALVLMNLYAMRKKASLAALEAEHRLAIGRRLQVSNFVVHQPDVCHKTLRELAIRQNLGVVVSRVRRGEEVFVPDGESHFKPGDVIVVVGTAEALQAAEPLFGERSMEQVQWVLAPIEERRVIVSRPERAGRTLAELDLEMKYHAQVTRLRRGDIDFVPDYNTKLQLGDRLRIVMPSSKADKISRFFGDSAAKLADIDLTALTLGISLGVLVGLVPIWLPGIPPVTLGIAGGPLIVALILGKLGRTGKVVWSLPWESNMALRHVGLILFLGGTGINAGGRFIDAIANAGGRIMVVGTLTALATSITALLAFSRVHRSRDDGSLPAPVMGAVSGVQTQPATLEVARKFAHSDDVLVAYASSYPLAMVLKIILVQALALR